MHPARYYRRRHIHVGGFGCTTLIIEGDLFFVVLSIFCRQRTVIVFFLGNTFEQKKKDTLLATGGFPEAFTRVSSSQMSLSPRAGLQRQVLCAERADISCH